MLGVRLSGELENRLTNLAEQTGHTKSYYVKQAIQEFLDNREDYLLGLAILEKQEATITLEELEQHLEHLKLENKDH